MLSAAGAGLPSPFFAERLPLGSKLRKAMLTRAVRVGFAALNRRDMEVLFAAYAPDLEVHGGSSAWSALGFGAVYRGQEGFRRMLADFEEGFESLDVEVLEVIDAGGGAFACRLDFAGVARGGLSVSQPIWNVYLARGGRVFRQEAYDSEEAALQALADARRATG
jgi:ketosteroid isomerase-like protein